uniref:helix-turn-helix domain-containing protein n=1 Tax=Escherichia coli TaxID=562 RepID=UPI0013D705D2
VQMLFEDAGTTFSEFVIECRLTAARRMLESPRYATSSITQIAFEAGFGDLSHFNRRFRRRYMMTPSDMRAQFEKCTVAG